MKRERQSHEGVSVDMDEHMYNGTYSQSLWHVPG